MQFRICINRSFEALHILEAKLMHNVEHACFDLFHLSEAELMNFFGRQICRCAFFDAEGVPCGAVWQRPGSWLGSTFGSVLVTHEGCEFYITGSYGIFDCSEARIVEALAVGFGDGG